MVTVHDSNVAPFAGAWIEIYKKAQGIQRLPSLRSRERGLKLDYSENVSASDLSLRSRERGLKSFSVYINVCYPFVAPFAGAWIEIFTAIILLRRIQVAPFAGAWIEIGFRARHRGKIASLPSRERGLKSETGR